MMNLRLDYVHADFLRNFVVFCKMSYVFAFFNAQFNLSILLMQFNEGAPSVNNRLSVNSGEKHVRRN
jgi:hypothetical protein